MNRAAGAVSLALVLLASGCGDDGGASPTLPPLTVTPSASATSSPTVTASGTPTATTSLRAFPDTPQGASAFGRFLHTEIDRAYREKDPEVVRPYFDVDCDACSRYLNTLEQLQSGAVTVERSSPVIISSESPGVPGPRLVFLRQRKAKVVFKDATGKVIGEEPAGESTLKMTVRRVGGTYVLLSQTLSAS